MRFYYCLLLYVLCFLPIAPAVAGTKSLIVAGGCFWCVEADFEKLDGVTGAVSGYIGGHVTNPTYSQVASGNTGHFEAVRISYDPAKISLRQLVDYFWKTIDPSDANGQFCDKGSPYKTALFYQDDKQQQALDLVMETVEDLFKERGEEDKVWGSMVKQALKRRKPGFSETYHGFRSFGQLLEEAEKRQLLELKRDEKSGGYVIKGYAQEN